MLYVLLAALVALDPASAEIGPHAREAAEHASDPAAEWTRGAVISEARSFSAPQLARRVYGYAPSWAGLNLATLRWDLLSDVIAFSVNIHTDGTIANPSGLPGSALVSAAHAHGVKVHLCATLFNTSSPGGEVSTFLASTTAQARAIDSLVQLVKSAGGDGLNLDFEFVSSTHRDAFTAFVRNAHDSLQAAIPAAELTLAMPSSTGYAGYDAAKLAAVTERLLLMEYDWHWRTAPQAGANSPLPSVEHAVDGFAAVAPVASLALGVPYYGYEWATSSAAVGANANGPGSVVLIKDVFAKFASYGRLWDPASETPWYLPAGKQGWCDDDQSLALKYAYVNSKSLNGIMIWALGYDGARTEMWNAIAAAFSTVTPPSDGSLQIVSAVFSPASIPAGGLVTATVRVKNNGGQTIGAVAPPPSTIYDESQSSTGSIAGSFRVAVDFADRPSSQQAHPFRWGLESPLAAGAEATLQAQVRLENPGTRTLWAAVVHEGFAVPQDDVGQTQIEVLDADAGLPDAGDADAGGPDAGIDPSLPDAGPTRPLAPAGGCAQPGAGWLSLLGLAALRRRR